MALSNWDCLAFDETGQPSNGSFPGFGEDRVEIYKNWLYIRDPDLWRPNKYMKPTIAEISHGDICLSGVHIRAVRHDLQNSIFAFVSFRKYSGEGPQTKYFCGIGCYGYQNQIEKLARDLGVDLTGIPDERILESTDYSEKSGKKIHRLLILHPDGMGKDQYALETTLDDDSYEPQFVGVTVETYRAFIEWLSKEVHKEGGPEVESWFQMVKGQTPKRFNLGDAFFVGVEQSSTNIGSQSADPLLTRAIEGLL